MEIFVISLKNSKCRSEFDKLNKNIIHYQYFDAIDGNNVKLDSNIIKKNTIGYTKGQIGCALSHLCMWEKCIKLNRPIVIMEDDAFVSYDFNKNLDSIIKMLPNRWQLLQLCYNCDSILSYSNTNFENAISIFTKKKFDDNDILEFQKSKIHPTIAKLNISFGAGCYVLNPDGAKFLKRECFPLDNRILNVPFVGNLKAYTIDCMMTYLYNKMNAYVCPIPFVMTKHLYIKYVSEASIVNVIKRKILIYSCVFYNDKYINLINLLLKSYILFGNPSETIDYLIICNPKFENKIQNIFQNLKINGKIWCLDLNTKFEACYSRLKIFNYIDIDLYNKILYLDCDILITNSINNMLDFQLENKLYALKENCHRIYHYEKFTDEEYKLLDKNSSFTSGILLFNNNIIIKNLFSEILKHIKNDIETSSPILFFDQPFIVYHAIKNNLYNNQKLIGLVINNPKNFNGEIISHFPGGPGHYGSKIIKMTNFMNNIMFNVNKNNHNIPEIIPHKFIDKVLSERTTMVSKKRLINLYKQCNKFKNTNYSFVECGVAKGGCLALMKYVAGDNNKIFGFDSFEGMPDIDKEKDIGSWNKSCPLTGYGKIGDNLSGGIKSVYNTFEKLDLNFHNTELIKGFFKNTLKVKENINKLGDIAVLRLDGDWYNSVKICLDELYDKVVNGGVIIIDDYGHFIGAKNATDEFRVINNIKSPLLQTDYTEFYWVKKSSVKIKKNNSVNIYDDLWTCSDEFREDIKHFFKGKSHYKIAEIGSHKGYTTGYLSGIFETVYAVDNSVKWTNFNKSFNKDRKNIVYVHLDIYKDSWNVIPDVDVVFIDAGHSYECCKSDIYNSIKRFVNLKYIIFDDYGVWSGVKQIVNECLINNMLMFEKHIGLIDVPGPSKKIFTNTSEGIICKVNPITNKLINRNYKWQNSKITFLENGQMNAFGIGKYKFLKKHLVKCDFGNREHFLKFNEDYSRFISVRKDDFHIVNGSNNILNVYQNESDGFGHQMEGLIRLVSLHMNNKIFYNYNYKKEYSFEHTNYNKELLIKYFKNSLNLLKNISEPFETSLIDQKIIGLDGVGFGQELPEYFENTNTDLTKNLKKLREIFVTKNVDLPKPIYNINNHNICIHIRLGDAITTGRKLDKNIMKTIDIFKLKYPNSYIHVFSDEPEKINYKKDKKIILYDKNIDVLDIFSSFIHSDILVISYSSLSIASHLLGKKTQTVYIPDIAGPTLQHRVLKKCKKISCLMKMYYIE